MPHEKLSYNLSDSETKEKNVNEKVTESDLGDKRMLWCSARKGALQPEMYIRNPGQETFLRVTNLLSKALHRMMERICGLRAVDSWIPWATTIAVVPLLRKVLIK